MIARIALFDIDGTLLTTNGQAVEAMMAAMEEVYGLRPDSDGFLMDGKTELRIVHELMAGCGVGRQAVTAGLAQFWHRYAGHLDKRILPGRITVYTGVRELISRLLKRDDVLIGLLTGNCPAAARCKLGAAGLGGSFAFGAYGHEHEERGDLPSLALAEAHRRYGVRLAGKDVVVLGDTPNDILCARPWGLRTIAVATGRFGREELESYRPDSLFADFSDGDAVLCSIFSAAES